MWSASVEVNMLWKPHQRIYWQIDNNLCSVIFNIAQTLSMKKSFCICLSESEGPVSELKGRIQSLLLGTSAHPLFVAVLQPVLCQLYKTHFV